MAIPESLLAVWTLYVLYVEAKYKPVPAKRILNETQSAVMRILLRGLGYEQESTGRKMTRAEVDAAKAFMATCSVEQLFAACTAVEVGFKALELSESSRKTYGGRLKQFITWCEEQPWWGKTGVAVSLNTPASYCPPMRRGHGKARENQLTDRRFVYQTYQLQPQDTLADLAAELDEFEHFLTDPDRSDRRMDKISESAAKTYRKHICLILGWFFLKGTPRQHLSLDLLIPKLTEEALEHLSPEARELCWKARKSYIDRWICQYFEFLRDEEGAKSPSTKKFKTHALTALGKFQYRTEVGSYRDYSSIPVLKTIKKYSNNVKREVKCWNQNNHRVVPINKKWPHVVAGETALTTIRKQVVEELRLFCRPKYSCNWHFRSGSAITSSLRDYLAWGMMTDMPARRQEEARSWKVALTCPLNRPDRLPGNGIYQPLPPDHVRERDLDNQIADNYLYKTYQHNGRSYPEGVWVLDIHNYKTQQRYGPQSIKIRNHQLSDGTYFYDYIETYLYGFWYPIEEDDDSFAYTWWDTSISGQQGQWISAGRLEYQSQGFPCRGDGAEANAWFFGYFFIMPRAGRAYNDSDFKDFFSTAAHKVIGKRINPHILRDMWATWSYQVGLTDAQRESLAYAMGMDIKTLKEIYDRCSPDEKRRPIEEVIDKVLFGELEAEYHQSKFYLEKLAEELSLLTEAERFQHIQRMFSQ